MEALDIVGKYVDGVDTFGYLLLFLYSLTGGFVGIIVASVLSSVGKLDFGTTVAIAALGNFVGSTFFAYLARTQKGEFLKYFGKHRRKIAYVRLQIRKYDWYVVIIAKYLHGIRLFVPAVLGLSGYNLRKFALINFLASLLWGLLIGLIAYHASGVFLLIIEFLLENKFMIPIVFISIMALAWVVHYFYISRAK